LPISALSGCGKGHPWPFTGVKVESLLEELEESYTVHPAQKSWVKNNKIDM
jgi:hypothetical protein